MSGRQDHRQRLERIDQQNEVAKQEGRFRLIRPSRKYERDAQQEAGTRLGDRRAILFNFLLTFIPTLALGALAIVLRNIPSMSESWLLVELNSLLISVLVISGLCAGVLLFLDNFTTYGIEYALPKPVGFIGGVFVACLVVFLMLPKLEPYLADWIEPEESEAAWWEIWR